MIYIHVPFCKSFCTYCDFYSETACGNEAFGRYAEEIRSEMAERSAELALTRDLDTLYIGGGTPSVLTPSVLSRILGGLPGGSVRDEFTIEVNPEDIVEKGSGYVRSLAALGVNRISMGVQSLNDGVLNWMNRRHNAERARTAFRILREGGFRNISVDIIFGFRLPEGDFLENTVREIAFEWKPEHISAYQLSLEEGSALADLNRRGLWEEAPDEFCRNQYEFTCDLLREAGYLHYEISNWAIPGHEARHNSAYWTRHPYIGFGPAAHSLERENTRRWNNDKLSGWTSDSEILTPEQILQERIMLGLRTSDGIGISLLDKKLAEKHLKNGNLEMNGNKVRIPESRWFISDGIISDLA